MSTTCLTPSEIAAPQFARYQVNSIADLRAIVVLSASFLSTTGRFAVVGGYYSEGDGGGGEYTYDADNATADDGGSVIKPTNVTGNGRWVIVPNGKPLSVKQFGAKTDGTDSTAAITAALAATDDIYIPAGTFNISSIAVSSNKKITGAGVNRSFLLSSVTGTTDAVKGSGAVVSGVTLENFCIKGVDGNGGTALHLNSFTASTFFNIKLAMFRNAGKQGVGLKMTNDYGICALNSFFGLWVENCNDAHTQISTNASHSVGYNQYFGTVFYQEDNILQLLVGAGNGGIYNSFFGFTIQGNGAAGTYIKIQGSGNQIHGVVLDQPGPGTRLEFTSSNTSGNYVSFLTGWDASKFVDNYTTGAANTVHTGDNSSYSPGRSFSRVQTLGSELKTQDRAPGATGSIEMNMGNDTSAQLWRWVMQGSATPYWQLTGPSGVRVYRWFSTYHSRFAGDIERERLTADGLVIEPSAVAADCVASAALEVRSESKGFLPPRMTTAQRDAIVAPATGLVIYNTSTNKLNVRAAAAWEAVTSA